MELNVNPAKVVALYPEIVAGRLSVPQDQWIPLYEGPSRDHPRTQNENEPTSEHGKSGDGDTEDNSSDQASSRGRSPPPKERKKMKSPLDAIRPSPQKDSDSASIASTRKLRPNGMFYDIFKAIRKPVPI